MSAKSERLLQRIQRMEEKLDGLKCEYNMLLCKEDHDGNLEEFAQSITNEQQLFRGGDSRERVQTIISIPPSGEHKQEQPL